MQPWTEALPKCLLSGSVHDGCGQAATHNGMFLYFPVIFIAAMAIRNIQLRILRISH